MRWRGALLLFCVGACSSGGIDIKAPVYTPVSATTDGSLYTMTLGDLKMVVDSAHGARIIEFSFRRKNVLVTQDENINYGSTYWPSPQASWCTVGGGCWPPPDAIDSGPYAGMLQLIPSNLEATGQFQLTSGPQSLAGIPGSSFTVSKAFSPLPESGGILVTYTLTNTSTTDALSLAPWQVSRVAAGGLTFFGQGSGAVTYAPNTASTFTVDAMGGDLWYQSAPVTHDSKAFADGTGWLAQVTPDRLLYLVSHGDIGPSDAAPGEAEVEIYTNSSYVELEAQGRFESIAPGGSMVFGVLWQLRPVPNDTMVAEGSADLASLVTQTLAE
jgi:hypothetical protein